VHGKRTRDALAGGPEGTRALLHLREAPALQDFALALPDVPGQKDREAEGATRGRTGPPADRSPEGLTMSNKSVYIPESRMTATQRQKAALRGLERARSHCVK